MSDSVQNNKIFKITDGPKGWIEKRLGSGAYKLFNGGMENFADLMHKLNAKGELAARVHKKRVAKILISERWVDFDLNLANAGPNELFSAFNGLVELSPPNYQGTKGPTKQEWWDDECKKVDAVLLLATPMTSKEFDRLSRDYKNVSQEKEGVAHEIALALKLNKPVYYAALGDGGKANIIRLTLKNGNIQLSWPLNGSADLGVSGFREDFLEYNYCTTKAWTDAHTKRHKAVEGKLGVL